VERGLLKYFLERSLYERMTIIDEKRRTHETQSTYFHDAAGNGFCCSPG